MSPRTLIRGGCVLTLGAGTPNHPEADVLIDGDRIAEIGTTVRARDAEIVDASGCIVMPGFVDAHRHLWQTLLRHGGATGTGGPASDLAATYGERYRPDDLYAATLIGLLSAVEAGVTTVVDWCELAHDDTATEAVLQAYHDAAVRTVLLRGDPAPGPGPKQPPTATAAYASPNPGAADDDHLRGLWSRARGAGLRIHAHLGARAGDTGRAVQLRDRGLLGADVTLVHCSTLSGEDLDAIAAAGARVAVTPASEMAAGIGPPPVQGLIDRGIAPGLGVDDEVLGSGDLFSQMRSIQSIQHATHFEMKLAGKGGLPTLLTTREVIRWATLAGADAAGLGEVTGSLEVGKQADVLVLRADRPNIHPVNDPIGAVVWGMEPTNVDWVFVAGRSRVRAGELDADVPGARELAIAAHRHVVGAADGLVDLPTGGPR